MKTNKQFKPNSTILVIGTVIDSISGKGISGASVELTYATGINSATYLKRIAVASNDGKFFFENIPFLPKYSMVVSAAGYETSFREVLLPSVQNNKIRTKNIGIIKLWSQPKMLSNVTVTAITAPSMQFS